MKAGARLHIDGVALALVAGIVLLGLIMVTSASISIAGRMAAMRFRSSSVSWCCAWWVACWPAGVLHPHRIHREDGLAAADRGRRAAVRGADPGLGHVVNGSRRWIRLLGFNFQASELARVLVLIFIASYAVRREDELRQHRDGLVKPILLLGFIALLLLAEPDFGAASVLFIAGFGILFGPVRACATCCWRRWPARPPWRCWCCWCRTAMAACHLVPRSVGRSVQQRIPAHPVVDRDWPRRVVRRGTRRERAEAVLSTGGAHRLPVRGAGRGAGAGGRGGDTGAVHRAGVAQFSGSRS
jgi:hypothetical protein